MQTVKEFDKLAGTTADKAAGIIIAGIMKNKRRILVGPDAYVFDVLARTFPKGFVGVVAAVAGRK